ncbi:unnamed protein product [Amoebophrya sp. A120]|nr:unnamed protein product [Amoebophrya sp. A120]|eukprot:GSA120T00008951001.1
MARSFFRRVLAASASGGCVSVYNFHAALLGGQGTSETIPSTSYFSPVLAASPGSWPGSSSDPELRTSRHRSTSSRASSASRHEQGKRAPSRPRSTSRVGPRGEGENAVGGGPITLSTVVAQYPLPHTTLPSCDGLFGGKEEINTAGGCTTPIPISISDSLSGGKDGTNAARKPIPISISEAVSRPCGKVSRIEAIHRRLGDWAKKGRVEDAESLFNSMQAVGLWPHVDAYFALMSAYAKRGDAEGAERVLERMELAGLSPIRVSSSDQQIFQGHNLQRRDQIYSAVLDAYTKNGNAEGAERVRQKLAAFYATAIQYSREKGQPCTLPGLASVLQRAGFRPDVTSYNALIGAYAERGDAVGAGSTFERMKSAGVAPDIATYNTLLQAHVRKARTSIGDTDARKGIREVLDLISADENVEKDEHTQSLISDYYRVCTRHVKTLEIPSEAHDPAPATVQP